MKYKTDDTTKKQVAALSEQVAALTRANKRLLSLLFDLFDNPDTKRNFLTIYKIISPDYKNPELERQLAEYKESYEEREEKTKTWLEQRELFAAAKKETAENWKEMLSKIREPIWFYHGKYALTRNGEIISKTTGTVMASALIYQSCDGSYLTIKNGIKFNIGAMLCDYLNGDVNCLNDINKYPYRDTGLKEFIRQKEGDEEC